MTKLPKPVAWLENGPGRLSEVPFLATSPELADRNLENPTGFLHFRQPAATGNFSHCIGWTGCGSIIVVVGERGSRLVRPRRCPNDGVHLN